MEFPNEAFDFFVSERYGDGLTDLYFCLKFGGDGVGE